MFKILAAHPYLLSVVGTFLLNNVVTALVSSLPAPTKDSTLRYVYWFKVLNTVIGNLQRAASTSIENSPNFQAAVEAYVQRMDQMKTWQPGAPR
jgi:hypothetical protein